MKKLLFAAAALVATLTASAQELGGFTAQPSRDSFIPFEDGTPVGFPVANIAKATFLKDATYAGTTSTPTSDGTGFEIGFEFPFNGQKFTHFGVYGFGGVKLGTDAPFSMNYASFPFTGAKNDNSIFCADTWTQSYTTAEGDSTLISYKTIGEPGSRKLVVQYLNMGLNTSSYNKDLVGTYSLQLYLCEDGSAYVIYEGLSDLPSSTVGNVFFGVRGVGSSDFVSFENIFSEPVGYFSTSKTNPFKPVVDGYTVKLVPPTDVTRPTTQPTDLDVEYMGQSLGVAMNITFTKDPQADRTLVVLYEGKPEALPEDKVLYAEKDVIGNGVVCIADATNPNATSSYKQVTQKKRDTEYYLVAYSYNSYGTNGPLYNTTNPATKVFTTSPYAPASIKLTAFDANSLEIAVESNQNNDYVFVAYSDQTWNPGNYGARPLTGDPDANAKVGDVLTLTYTERQWNEELGESEYFTYTIQTGTVAYFGRTGSFKLENLEPSTGYYFNVFSYNPKTQQFSCGDDTLQLWSSTTIVPTYELNMLDVPENRVPAGWTRSNDTQGFGVQASGRGNIKSGQVSGARIFQCVRNAKSPQILTSPTIALPDSSNLSFAFHIHGRSSGYMARDAVYDEWEPADAVEIRLLVEGEDEPVVLEKFDEKNIPTAAVESTTSWGTYSYDLSAYKGKKVRVQWYWNCVATSMAYMGIENIAVYDNTSSGEDDPDGPDDPDTSIRTNLLDMSDSDIFNVSGQKVDEPANGIVIVNGKKIMVK